jgi:MFS-type transporter involved in bile tolerance (Atg22 family)
MPLWLNNSSFALLPAGYLGSAVLFIFITQCLQFEPHEKTQIIVSGLLLAFSNCLAGPSHLLPDNYNLIFISLLLQGFFFTVVNLPLLYVAQQEIKKEFGDERANELSEISAGIYSMSY